MTLPRVRGRAGGYVSRKVQTHHIRFGALPMSASGGEPARAANLLDGAAQELLDEAGEDHEHVASLRAQAAAMRSDQSVAIE